MKSTCDCHESWQPLRNPSPHNASILSAAESTLHTDISTARVAFESSLVDAFAYSKDSKIYDYIRSFSKSGGIPSVLQYQSQTLTGKANVFNDFFHFVFNSSCTDVALTDLPFPATSLCSISITMEDTFAVLATLDPSKAMGGDGIPPIVLQQCAAAFVEPVHHLFSQCLSQSYLPIEWRTHNITPIPKSKDHSPISSYRPISLLSCLSKALERLAFDKISDFVFENVISQSQFGFVRNRSTLQQLLKYVDFLHSSLDNCQQVDSIYLNISKAFHSVSHGKVLAKLWSSSLTGSLWRFFKCYLTDRKQRVIVDGEVSRWLPVTSGVPQGSILGPLLFIIYINDLPSILKSSTPYLFANDTKCCSRVLSLNDAVFLQADLDNLSEWCQENDLSFNTSKSIQTDLLLASVEAPPYKGHLPSGADSTGGVPNTFSTISNLTTNLDSFLLTSSSHVHV